MLYQLSYAHRKFDQSILRHAGWNRKLCRVNAIRGPVRRNSAPAKLFRLAEGNRCGVTAPTGALFQARARLIGPRPIRSVAQVQQPMFTRLASLTTFLMG